MSMLRSLWPIVKMLPEVEKPKFTPSFKEKMTWTIGALLVFFFFGQIPPFGLSSSATGFFEQLQVILASQIGTLATLGIGPIVMASIILQLLVGAQLIDLDLSKEEDKSLFQGVQKLFAIVLCFVEGGIYVLSGYITPSAGMAAIVILQLAFASILLMFLDEVVTKWGIGSGIGLFIAGGVSSSVIVRAFNPFMDSGYFIGNVPLFLQLAAQGVVNSTTIGIILPTLFAVVVFLMVAFLESMRVEIPLTMGRIRGIGGKYPLKFLYVSNIPVILVAALFANVQLWGTFLYQSGINVEVPLVHFKIPGDFERQESGGRVQWVAKNGLAYYVQAPYGYLGTYENVVQTIFDPAREELFGVIPRRIFHIIFYALIFILCCTVFGRFWIETTGMGAADLAKQLKQSGLQIPGFRRDPRVTERILDRYVPKLAILGSAFVGLLAAFADLTGALGTGTGILLTVGIVYKLYEEIAHQQMMDLHPMVRKLFSK